MVKNIELCSYIKLKYVNQLYVNIMSKVSNAVQRAAIRTLYTSIMPTLLSQYCLWKCAHTHAQRRARSTFYA